MKAVVVVGGGVVGLCCALQLQRRGLDVTVVERNTPGDSATWASCGHIALSEVVPQSRPGTLKKIPRWLLDPLGPLAVRPRALPGILPWMLRFVGNARTARLEHITRHLSALTVRSRNDYAELLAGYNLDELIRDKPVIEVYDSEAELQHERPYHELRRQQGFDIEEISGAEAADIEPALARDFASAVVFRDWRSVVDTHRFLTAITEAFTASGGRWIRADVESLEIASGVAGGVRLHTGDVKNADHIVVAAGAWSTRLMGKVGIKIPVAALLGYQTMVRDPGFSMQHGVIYAKGGFGITPYEQGIGIAGTIEFAGLDSEPDYRRAQILADKARRVVPGLNVVDAVERVGRRPFCPDTLPIIGGVPGLQNLTLATGHGQLGLTLGATTGLLVSRHILGETPEVDLNSYSLSRF